MARWNLDMEELGRDIQDIVDRAINSQDYGKLNQTVTQTVERAGEAIQQAVQSVSGGLRYRSSPEAERKKALQQLYGKTGKKAFGAVLQMAAGIPIAFVLWLLLLLGYTAGGVRVLTDLSSALFLALCAAPFTWLSWRGITTWKRIGRFRIYRKTIGENTYCSLGKLARSVEKSVPFVRRDVRKMIRMGLFKEGHLDNEETCLIISNETYRYFEESRLQMEDRKRQEALEAAQARKKESVTRSPQVQEVLDKGNAFLAQIRKCNDDIPGMEISNKISRMETIVQRIFQRAEAAPEIIPDLKKLMDYYLPMTVKLLNAYAEMDAQPVQGENILSAKREIEGTLDTLNRAYERLLDELYADTAMDVSSDISVLQTLLAQEGLAGDEIAKK